MLIVVFLKRHKKKRGNQLAEARVSTPTNQTSCSTPYLNTAFVNCPLIGCQLRLVEIELQGIAQTLFFYVCQFVFLHDIFVLQCDCKDRNVFWKKKIFSIKRLHKWKKVVFLQSDSSRHASRWTAHQGGTFYFFILWSTLRNLLPLRNKLKH